MTALRVRGLGGEVRAVGFGGLRGRNSATANLPQQWIINRFLKRTLSAEFAINLANYCTPLPQ